MRSEKISKKETKFSGKQTIAEHTHTGTVHTHNIHKTLCSSGVEFEEDGAPEGSNGSIAGGATAT